MKKILLFILAAFVGSMVASYGVQAGTRLDIAGYHIHHNVLGIILVLLPLLAFLYRRLPFSKILRRFAWPIAGLGVGIFAHHQVTEGFKMLLKIGGG